MARIMRGWKLGWICAAILLAVTINTSAFAQGQPPGGGGGGRGFGRGGFGGQPSLATTPVPYLAWALNHNDDQKTKIQAVQDKVRTDMRAAFQPDASGQRPDPATAQAKMKEVQDQAKTDIEAVLTDTQKKKTESVLKEAGTYNSVGLPLGAVPDLKLTADQKTKLADIGAAVAKEQQATMKEMQDARQNQDQQKMQELFTSMQSSRKATQEKVQAILNDEQKAALDKYVKDHPQPQRGRGGPGGPGGGGGAGNV